MPGSKTPDQNRIARNVRFNRNTTEIGDHIFKYFTRNNRVRTEFGIITRVENQDILLPIDVELLHKIAHFIFVVADGIESEILVSVHVVDVIPHGIQGDVCLLVILHHRLELIHSVVTPPALVEAYTQP